MELVSVFHVPISNAAYAVGGGEMRRYVAHQITVGFEGSRTAPVQAYTVFLPGKQVSFGVVARLVMQDAIRAVARVWLPEQRSDRRSRESACRADEHEKPKFVIKRRCQREGEQGTLHERVDDDRHVQTTWETT